MSADPSNLATNSDGHKYYWLEDNKKINKKKKLRYLLYKSE